MGKMEDNPGRDAAYTPEPKPVEGLPDGNIYSSPLSVGELTCSLHAPCFVVGIGASAGGQQPLEHIFTAVPTDCDISFVVVMHIPPDGPPFLADLIRRYTSMEVLTAEEGMPLRPNTVYVIPPGVTLTVKDGRLRLNQSIAPARTHHPIDSFFTSLAADCGNRAIAVILSGFGLDGAEGVKRVKEAGGTVIAQDPATAINPPMPQNAIATGAVDMVLPADDIPGRIADIAHGHCSLLPEACKAATLDEELQAIFAQVKVRTGHDFSSYKRNTVLRRIERRMTVNEAGGLRKYLTILEENPQEAQALSQEILIGVTSFFRDPEAFEFLKSEIIPSLFTVRDPEDPVRIWHACCATGEEAYSVAMLIHEYLEKEDLRVKTQIFATDIDEGAVAQARSGLYPSDIEPEVGEERLKNFFTRTDGRWQVSKQLREKIVFAHHSIIKDPPFSRLDLLVCRNFLIYLDPDMQKRLISLFHMVLKPGGFLFLGASETVGHNSDLFMPLDKKWKIYRRMDSGRREETFFPITSPIRRLTRYAPAKRTAEAGEPAPWDVAERLLVERYSPPCIVVNEKYEAIHVSTRTGRYLEVPTGEPTRDVLRMAREDLRPALRAAIYKSFAEQKQVAFRGVKVNFDDGKAAVNVLVEPLAVDSVYGRLAMVILEPAPSPASPQLSPGGEALPTDEASKDMLIRQLEDQLRITHEQLHATAEQLETSNESFLSANEELMSINEEFQSTNEELQSTNEELETSKEELQALNEELVTVNSELQGKLEELNQLNSDMENLFASSELAAIFLDRALKIKRFSPAMAAIFNLIPADIGRPFRHLAGTVDWTAYLEDVNTVLEKQLPVEREVSAVGDGRNFLLRVLPYRSQAGGIDGIVVTLVDVSELKLAEEETRSIALFPLENPAPVLRLKKGGALLFANRAAETMLEEWRAEHGDDAPYTLFSCIEKSINSGEPLECEVDSSGRAISFVVVPFPEREYANLYGRDITERKLAEEELRRAKEEWERTFASVPDLITILDNEHRVLRVNESMARRLGLKPEECVGLHCYEAVHGTSCPPQLCPHLRTMEDGREHVEELNVERFGGDFLVTTTPLLDAKGESIGSVHIARDITERKRSEDMLSARLRLMEFANTHSLAEILRETLDEVGKLTGSPIGFYHFVEADQQTLSLQAWSSRTLNEFCTATGQGSHYKIDDAGVWVECVHQRRPVIHNDYESLPNRKGMPEGHARVVRELVVPILRGGNIVAILGVGNKSSDYTEKDVEVVSYLADIAWEIFVRKQAEEDLRHARETAETANRAKSLFLANMSHELRTPMTGVLGMLEIARSGPLDERQREAIDTAYMSGRSLLMILNDILDLTRIETGKLVIDEKPFSLRECLSGAVNILMPEARRKGIGLAWSLAADAPETVTGDRFRLQQVLTNLAGNAVKFTEKGKVDVTVRIGGETGDGKREFVFAVVDTGIGIPADKMEIIFQTFCQLDNSHSRRYGGTGLGLAISRDIVGLMGGVISCESAEGEGSTFTFTVPMAVAEHSAAPSPEAASSLPMKETVHNDELLKGKRLLVAEDDEVTRNVLGFMLQKSGFEFDFAMNGVQVVEMWEKGGYDLIVMDGQMPGMDGFEATRTIRERERKQGGHIPIVAMTAHALKEDRDRCLAAGMDDYVSKPIDFGRCMEVIRGLFCNCGREDE